MKVLTQHSIYLLFLHMEPKSQTTRHWRQIHRARRQSTGSLSQSMNSNRSSLSSGYSRFHFQKGSESDGKRGESIFHFKARDKKNPYDVSLLIKKQELITPRISRASRVQTEQDLPNLEKILKKMPTFNDKGGETSRTNKATMVSLINQLKETIELVKSTVDYFNKQFKQLKQEWEKNLKNLSLKSHLFDNNVVLELKNKLDQKQKELDIFAKDASFLDKNQFAANISEVRPDAQSSLIDSPMKNLGISKVDKPTQQDLLSRNNTLQSLLNVQQRTFSSSSLQKPHKQVASLQERLRKMRQVLDCPS